MFVENNWNIKALYFGYIKDESCILGYVCIVPIDCARNGFITQQLMPGLLPIYSNEKPSLRINSRPVYIFDFLNQAHTRYQLTTITNFKLIGHHYFDMIPNRNIEEEYNDKDARNKFTDLIDLDNYFVSMSRSNPKKNEYFKLDVENHVVYLLKNTLKQRDANYFEALTNEPYYYFGRLFLFIHYSLINHWKINMDDFGDYVFGTNVNVDCIIKYIKVAIEGED